MPEISLNEQQVEALEELQNQIADEHVGRYGHVRLCDVVQFLLDRYAAEDRVERETVRRVIEHQLADRSYQELQRLAADTDGVKAGGKADDLRARLLTARTDELLTELASDPGSANEDAVTATGSPTDTPERDEAGDTNSGGSAASSETTSNGATPPEDEDAEDGGSRLERMMGLLDRHEEHWEQTDSDEGRYAVTLPDGSVETVRTKDDVRATLFKHYD